MMIITSDETLLKLITMDLSVRALNCLKAADTLGDLVSFNKMT
jgi:hypothetical protein